MTATITKVNITFLLICFTAICAGSRLPPSNEGRIVGGWETLIVNFPHQVSLQILNQHICGGSIIREDLVLTAAHCVTTFSNPKIYNIRAGSSLSDKNGIVVAVKSIKVHEYYNLPTFENNDIALVVLETPLSIDEYIQPIPLMATNEDLEDMTTLIVTGWGYTDSQLPQMSPILRYTVVNKLPQVMCENSYELAMEITDTMFCAGVEQGGRDSCQGDSGGPLVGVIENVVKLVGIVSFGLDCGLKEYPGVYTRVQNYNDWLNKTINEMSF